MLISYVNTKAFNKNNISEAVGCATKNTLSVKMLLSSYTTDKSVKIIHLLDSGTNEHTDLQIKNIIYNIYETQCLSPFEKQFSRSSLSACDNRAFLISLKLIRKRNSSMYRMFTCM